ncbi:hypothetical protein [uncultured Maribacter sp.]|uniref:hypothetical protein n=1 Tax=uncultured Maribacter sp. TaxID=431308 RepID=UPI002615790E|nr:hypothetical protein [uncultured Maribacter sp.]
MYVSPLSVLNISLEELMNLDSKGIIRLEKKLKAKQLRNSKEGYNPQQFHALLTQLQDEDAKKSIYFVEKHPLLKEFISTGDTTDIKTFSVDKELLAKTPNIAEFLSPYFDTFMMKLVKRDFANKKYDVIIRAMQYKELFTPNFLDTYYRYIINQLNIIIEIINITPKGKLIDKKIELTYGTFCYLLNTVPLGLIRSEKIAYINAMVDYYNATKNKHREFKKIQLVFDHMRKLYFDDFEMKRFVKKLAAQINNTEVLYESSGKKSSSGSTWSVIVIIAIIFRFFISINDFSSSSYKHTPVYPSNFPKEVGVNTKAFLDILKKRGHLRNDKEKFIKSLQLLSQDEMPYDMKFIGLSIGENPYKFDFSKFTDTTRTTIKFNNIGEEAVILFAERGINNKRAGYYQSNSKVNLDIAVGDTLRFYAGDFFGKFPGLRTVKLKTGYPESMFKYTSKKQRELLTKYYIVEALGNNAQLDFIDSTPIYKNLALKEEVMEELVKPEID